MGKAQSSVEARTVRHEHASARDERSQRSRLLLSRPLVGGVLHAAASAYTSALGTALFPLASRGTRRFARGRPTGSHGAAKRLPGYSCRRNTSMSRGTGRTMRQGPGGKRLGDPEKRAKAVGVVMLGLQR